MRILFYRYGSICENDIMDCFISSGHKVVEITTEIYEKNTSFKKSVEIVSKALDNMPCDCVFTVNFFPALSELCNIYHIRYICWTVDSPVLELFSKSVSNEWNRIFVFDREQYNDIVMHNPTRIFHYPLAVDSVKKQRAINEARSNGRNAKYKADISFVGSLYTEKSPYDRLIIDKSGYVCGYLEGIIQAQINLYGVYFIETLLNEDIIDIFKKSMPDYYHYELDNYLDDKLLISQYYIGNKISSLERIKLINRVTKKYDIDIYTGSDISVVASNRLHSKGRCSTEKEMPIVFNESKINLNPTSKAIRSGIPLRALDIMACEGFLLSNYQSELNELFVPGVHFAYYDSIEAVPEIIDYYLRHDNERKEIAHNAYCKVRDNYSYMIRLNELLLKAFEV